jgi:hypothetical protein
VEGIVERHGAGRRSAGASRGAGRLIRSLAAGAPLLAWPSIASAQSVYADYLYNDTAIVAPAIPEGFDKGRNQNVLEHENSDYQPQGIPFSSFLAYPRLDVTAGGTSNTYLTHADQKASGIVAFDPSLKILSDWSRNRLEFNGAADFQRFIGNSRRDQDNWNVGLSGDLEIGSDFKLTGEADGSREFESPYASAITSTLAVLSTYKSSFASVRGTYAAGRVRAILSVDNTSISFSPLDFGNGLEQSQQQRDRDVVRGSAQFEYALSPSISGYVQGVFDGINYDARLPDGSPNRDSNAYRLSVGVNFDLAGFARGTLAVGYVHREYASSLYKSVSGPSVESKIEFFPSYFTTVTLRFRRYLDDSSIGSNTPYFDNRIIVQVDHALLRNLFLQGVGSYDRVQYLSHLGTRNSYLISGGVSFLATPHFGLRGNVGYSRQIPGSVSLGTSNDEVRGLVGFYVQR